ncbi:MAG TPA: acyl-CoA reductase [Sandaracinaceae bacterium LLY-WYZ-13_1]|nr:acyl-CoA reductase [Sandaracinaceae bacterium LLY-WYZ-13_1]
MSRDPHEPALRETLARLEAAGSALRARSPEAVAASVARAWGSIADPELAPGRAARQRLPESTGLTLPMVAWALSATFEGLSEASLVDAARRMAPPEGAVAAPAGLGVLVLAGNVFTACVQPWSLGLIARAPLLVKASSEDDVLPRLFAEALAAQDPVLGEACAVVTFPGGTPALEATLLSRADVVNAYGSDTTLASIRGRLSPTTHFVPHGHGLGVGYVAALDSRDASRQAAEAFALDVAAYDQRGCMSPHAIFVAPGALGGAAFAEDLAAALDRRAEELPRGALPVDVGGAQLQWRSVARVRGTLHEGDGWAVGYEGEAALRVSPGWRNVMVLDTPDDGAFAAALAPLGVHLKTLGVFGDPATRRALAGALPAPLAPRVCAAGRMQRPPLLALADGRLPWEGLSRWIEVE